MDVKKVLQSDKGQALVEFLIFLPFMLMMYSVTISLSGAINASINQQKATRGYFYFRAAGNSSMPYPSFIGGADFRNAFSTFSMQMFGWADYLDGPTPVAPCYKFNLLLGENDEDICEESYSEPTTQFIRVMTAYGVCGANYQRVNGGVQAYPLVRTTGAPPARCGQRK